MVEYRGFVLHRLGEGYWYERKAKYADTMLWLHFLTLRTCRADIDFALDF